MKVNIFKIAVILLILAVSFSSCKGKEEIQEENEINSLTEYLLCKNVGSVCRWTDINEGVEAKVIFINSKEELEKCITSPKYSGSTRCSEFPTIDFSEHTLLLVQGWAPGYWTYTTPEEYPKSSLPKLQQRSPNEYILNIEMRKSDDGYNMQWNRAFIVNKISKKTVVEVDVTILLEENWSMTHDETASIIGQWKLVKQGGGLAMCALSVMIDYSQHDIIYEFRSNGVLTITGDPQHQIWPEIGEHSYSFIDENNGYEIPGLSYGLQIDDFSNFWYSISSEQLVVINGRLMVMLIILLKLTKTIWS